jgi:hypothetical protein
MIEIAYPPRRNSALFCRWPFDCAAPARPKILRPALPSTAAEKNIIP